MIGQPCYNHCKGNDVGKSRQQPIDIFDNQGFSGSPQYDLQKKLFCSRHPWKTCQKPQKPVGHFAQNALEQGLPAHNLYTGQQNESKGPARRLASSVTCRQPNHG
jgi:hypothetical protein